MTATLPASRGFNGDMAWLAILLLALAPQDPLEERVAELLREYPDAGDLDVLLQALEELGAEALLPISRALAEDLRDGMAAVASPALVDALVGHRGALEPLRSAFRDPKTSPEGRLEIARALDDLGDDSWRTELRKMSADARLDPLVRRRASDLLDLAAVVDEPRTSIVSEPPPRVSIRRKKTARPPLSPDTMAPALLLGGSMIVLTGLLLWGLRRKD
jgi:hypothetical protein